MRFQYALYMGLAIYGLTMYALLVRYTRKSGDWRISILCVWFSSLLPIACLALFVERRHWSDLISFQKLAWSFQIGDTIILPLIAVVATQGWLAMRTMSSVPVQGKRRKETRWSRLLALLDIGSGVWWGLSRWWTILCGGIGIAGGVGFHVLDGANYRAAGAGAALLSPTKAAHDLFIAYPVLLGGLACVVVPVLVRGEPRHKRMLWVLIAVMIAVMAADTTRGLNPHDMHPLWDPETFRVVQSN